MIKVKGALIDDVCMHEIHPYVGFHENMNIEIILYISMHIVKYSYLRNHKLYNIIFAYK